MLNSSLSPARIRLRSMLQFTVLVLAATLCPQGQQPTSENAKPTPAMIELAKLAQEKSAQGKSAQEKPQPKPDETTAAATALLQINNALEGLAAKVCPAVVQILVTGYGPLHEENR